ncbi:MAG: ion channel [bacterium]
MKRIFKSSIRIWHILLFASLLFAAFILPVLPPDWHKELFRVIYSIIYISAIMCLKKRSNFLLALVTVTLVFEWITGFFGFQLLAIFAKGTNVLFFLVIVFLLLKQIATAKEVNAEIILGAMIGYLLLGIIFSIFLTIIMQNDPSAFNIPLAVNQLPGNEPNVSTPLYYGYVTLATLGYGDIVPLKPYTRSLSTLIAISGQFYIAIIVALLVGKFAVKQEEADK